MKILSETPWWVFLLFLCLVIFGLKSLQPRTVSLKRLLVLPVIFTVWNIVWLADRVHEQYHLLIFWIGGMIIGSLLGWLSVRAWEVYVDRRLELITLPGTSSTLILILLIFAVRYFFNYSYAVHPHSAPHYYIADASISGLVTGIFIGRSLHLYRKYRHHHHENH